MTEFIKDTIIRAGYTFCEALLGYITVGQAIDSISWKLALSVSATAALYAIVKQAGVYLGTQRNEKFEIEDIDSNYKEA